MVGAEFRHVGVAGEAVEHRAAWGSDAQQGLDDRVVGLAIVDLHSQIVLLRDLDVRLE